jgi:E3 ubiquitin-protein ligase DOA10
MTETATAECRFCLESDVIENLLAPCLCKGSSMYVHNECLVRWYALEPRRGARCSACLTEYSQQYGTTELLTAPHACITLRLNYPLFTILFHNWALILMMQNTQGFLKVPTQAYYLLYQTINHIFMFYHLAAMIREVKKKQVYVRQWLTPDRLFLLFLHAYLVATLPETTWIGGAAADYCICLYFYAHRQILESMNRSYTIRFISLERS